MNTLRTSRPVNGGRTDAPTPEGGAGDPAGIGPLLSVAGLAILLNTSRRTVERLRSAGKLPRPDLHIGRMPRWKPETIRDWIEGGGQ